MTQPPTPHQEPLIVEAEPEREIDLSRWVEVIKRRWRLLAAICGAMVGVYVLLYLTTPKVYRAVTVVQIERRMSGPLKVEDILGTESYWDAQSFYPTQYKLLESRGLAERVVRLLRLAEDPAFNPPQGSLVPSDRIAEPDAAADAEMVARLAQRLRGGLSVSPIRDTRLVEISYVSHSPELAARVTNGVAEAYIDWGIELRGETAGRASSFLATQIESLKKEIQDTEASLQAYSRRTDIVALDPSSNVIVQRLEALNKDYTGAVSDRINKEARYQELMQSPPEAVADTLSGGVVAQLRSDVLRLEREYASKLSTYKPEWPAMQDLLAEITKARQNLQSVIDETVEKARTAAQAEYQTARRREQSLAAELARQKGEAMQLNSAAVEYNNLKVEVETRRALLDQLLRKQSETEVASRLQGSRDSNVVVVDRALVPRAAFRPSLRRNLALGLMLGLGLGLGTVFLLEYLDRTLKTEDDIERVLNLPVLAIIPDVASGSGHHGYYSYGTSRRRKQKKLLPLPQNDAESIELVCVRRPRLAVSEAYRGLRTAMTLSSAEKLQVVLVTSATVGEGKTATAGNLAVVFAQLGKRVLLVDADLRKPRQHAVFKITNRVGLVNVLTHQAEIDEVVTRIGESSLWIAPSGPIPPNPAELLSSERMREFLAGARETFDIVIVDSPPVLPVTDAAILSQSVDGTVMCVNAGTVTREDAVNGRNRLLMVDARVLGVVLNRYHNVSGHYSKSYYHQYQSYLERSDELPSSDQKAS